MDQQAPVAEVVVVPVAGVQITLPVAVVVLDYMAKVLAVPLVSLPAVKVVVAVAAAQTDKIVAFQTTVAEMADCMAVVVAQVAVAPWPAEAVVL
jgi:hypothetical protein